MDRFFVLIFRADRSVEHFGKEKEKMKKIKLFQWKKCKSKIFLKVAAAVLIAGMTGPCLMEAAASEVMPESIQSGDASESGGAPGNSTVTYVYHQHIGNSGEKGGCYTAPVCHVHEGNEEEGGSCYEKPVYHVHEGSEETGGLCYGTPVLHMHTGNPETGGGCFKATYHQHTDSCYERVSNSEYGCHVIKSWDTSDGDYEGHDYKYYEMSCGLTIHGTNSGHTHTILNCNQGSSVVGYTLGCKKTEKDADSYQFDCEKLEGISIDSYALSCEKTPETIDGYGIGCGKDEETPYGKITVTENQGGNKRETSMTAAFEDLSGGELQLADDPFVWYDQSGRKIGSGETLTVSENGGYSVRLGLINEDVDRESLKAEIKINSIIKPHQDNDHNNDDDDSDGDDNGGGDDGSQENEDGGQTQQTPAGQASPSPSATPTATPSASPSSTPAASSKTKKNDQASDGDSNGSGFNKADERSNQDKAGKNPPIPVPSPGFRKQTETVKLPEKKSSGEELQKIGTVEQDPEGGIRKLLSSPVVQVISITAGTLLALAGVLLLCYLLLMSVRVYNDDGEGKLVYLGRCRVRLKEEGYAIEITDAMTEKTVTNRYCIKPGFFRFLKGEDEELLVCCSGKKVSVSLSREMIVVI